MLRVQAAERSWRWIEVDRWGYRIHCAEDTWQKKVRQHPEIATHEHAIRATLREADALFYDPDSSARRQRPADQPQVWSVHYVGMGRAHGRQEGNFVRIVVRWEEDPSRRAIVGYVSTMLLTDSVEPRLQLLWEHHP